MNRIRYYIIIILLAFFVIGGIAASAMASCGNVASGQNAASIENSFDDGIGNSHYSVAAGHDRQEKVIQHDNFLSRDSDSTANCNSCGGTLCHTQSLVPKLAAHDLYDVSDNIHNNKEIDIKSIFLTKIPEPPKALS